MKLQRAYVSGFERRSFRAYGVVLHPLTLGHVQLLAELGSPIVYGLDCEKPDLTYIITAGSFPLWEQAREYIEKNSNDLVIFSERIAKNYSDEETRKVFDYLAYYLSKPRNRSSSVDRSETRIPWWWSYAEFLQTEMSRSEVDAWNTICSDAFAYYASYITRSGSEDFMTVREVFLAEQVESGKTIAQLFDEGVI